MWSGALKRAHRKSNKKLLSKKKGDRYTFLFNRIGYSMFLKAYLILQELFRGP
jgi:hypothetical protein